MDNDLYQKELLNIKKYFVESLNNYREHLENSSMDAPIEVLCLDKPINTILKKNGLFRVSDVAAADLTKIKGLGDIRILDIRIRLKEFLPM